MNVVSSSWLYINILCLELFYVTENVYVYVMENVKWKGQKDSSAHRVIAWHAANSGSIPGIPYGP